MTDPYERSCEILKTAEETQRIYRDEQLMREALKALDKVLRDLGVEQRYSVPISETQQRAREAIAKLEERLLQE